MATSTAALPSYNSDDATWRTWAQGIHDLLIAAGLTQTADTGQINLTTAPRPAANAFAGFEIFRFSDALQATLPVFIKVEYGTGGAADRPGLRVTAGTITSGAGVLSGQVSTTNFAIMGNQDVAGTLRTAGASGDGSQIHLFCSENAAGGAYGHGFCVERTRDETGAPTAAGFMICWMSSGSFTAQTVPASGSVPSSTSTPYVPLTSGRATVGNDVVMSPFLILLGRVYYTLMSAMDSSSVAAATVFTADILAATHTFRTFNLSSFTVAFPWE